MSIFRRKPITQPSDSDGSLRRCLTALDLTLLGIGAIIGAGVFVLTGIVAATKSGPAVTVSYIIAGLGSMFAALAYAEMATSIGGCGSAYSYAFTGFGELVAWIIGWNLLFEYTLSVATVAIGWSGYVDNALQVMHISLPHALIANPHDGGLVNLPAVLIIVVLAALLCIGVQQSARFNAAIVFIKLLTIAIFIGVASAHVNPTNWSHYAPFGWHGVMQGAALVFFAYIGFDALSTAAEETKDPQRSLPIGIITSVVFCSIVYVIVSALLTGIVPYTTLNVKSPVADALLTIGYPTIAGIIAAGAIAGLTTVMLVMYYGLTRICLAIARDGLLPKFFSKTNKKTQTPVPAIILSAVVIMLLSGFLQLNEVAELVNIGTLLAFAFVCAGVIVLRITQPDLPRPFKLPLNPLFPALGILFCGYLMVSLPMITWIRFVIWLALGLVIYFAYGRKRSVLHPTPLVMK